MLVDLAAKLLPKRAGDTLRRTVADFRLASALKPLRATGLLTHKEMLRFRRAWGNEAWSGDVRFLEETVRIIQAFGGPVLECGSGATSIIAGVLGERLGFDVYCLEQNQEWTERVRHSLKCEHLSRVRVIDAELVPYPEGGYVWYDVGQLDLPQSFGSVICDGPAVLPQWPEPYQTAWRRGLMPFLCSKTFGAVLLDDFDDERAPALIEHWVSRYGVTVETMSDTSGGCSIIRPGSFVSGNPT